MSSPPSYTTEIQPTSIKRRKSGSSDSSARPRSRRHSSHASDALKLPQEIINRIARQSVCSSRHIDADLLKLIAEKGGLPKDLDQEGLPKFKVITGSEATKVYEKTLRWVLIPLIL